MVANQQPFRHSSQFGRQGLGAPPLRGSQFWPAEAPTSGWEGVWGPSPKKGLVECIAVCWGDRRGIVGSSPSTGIAPPPEPPSLGRSSNRSAPRLRPGLALVGWDLDAYSTYEHPHSMSDRHIYISSLPEIPCPTPLRGHGNL